MRRIRHPGLRLCGFVLVAGVGMHGPVAAVTAPSISATGKLAAKPPRSSASEGGARIYYPPGDYPQLRLRNGEMHQIRSILNIARPLAFGDYVWDGTGVPPGQVWVRIDLARQLLSVFRDGHEIGTAVIIFGAKPHPTPVGTFHILEKSPYYYSRSYDAPMLYALRLTADGVALHASVVRRHEATHGCVGMPLEFARLLFAAVERGDEVEILPDDPA